MQHCNMFNLNVVDFKLKPSETTISNNISTHATKSHNLQQKKHNVWDVDTLLNTSQTSSWWLDEGKRYHPNGDINIMEGTCPRWTTPCINTYNKVGSERISYEPDLISKPSLLNYVSYVILCQSVSSYLATLNSKPQSNTTRQTYRQTTNY